VDDALRNSPAIALASLVIDQFAPAIHFPMTATLHDRSLQERLRIQQHPGGDRRGHQRGQHRCRHGTYCENLVISKNLTFSGDAPATTTIDGQYRGTAIWIKSGVVTISHVWWIPVSRARIALL
jgi:hypothetical protein